jgi:magnesium transporter
VGQADREPMIRAWVADANGARVVTPEEAVREITGGTGMVWIDMDCEDEASARALLAPLSIHPLVLDDMVSEINRPKVDNYGDYIYVVVHSARWEEARPGIREIDILVGRNFLVTYHDGASRSIAAAHAALERRPQLLADGPAHLLHYILDVLVDLYLPIMDRISDEIDEFEERIFDETRPLEHVRIIRLKRGMSALRRIVGPERDLLLALTRDEFKPIPADLRPYLRDVYDRLARISDLLDSFRDESATVLELHISMVSNRLNEIIKRLTVLATVGLPLTLVTSYYGMNFAFPEYHLRHPWIYALGLLVITAAGTWWYLQRKRWL